MKQIFKFILIIILLNALSSFLYTYHLIKYCPLVMGVVVVIPIIIMCTSTYLVVSSVRYKEYPTESEAIIGYLKETTRKYALKIFFATLLFGIIISNINLVNIASLSMGYPEYDFLKIFLICFANSFLYNSRAVVMFMVYLIGICALHYKFVENKKETKPTIRNKKASSKR